MKRGNVLVIGNSGVGKSTLINAVLGEEKAVTGWGTEGTTKELKMYTNEEIPFRVIDTPGFEPVKMAKNKAIKAVKKWSKESAKEGKEDTQINAIWFCVEGTSSKLFPKTIKDLSRATAMWETVPIIVIITKSYSIPEREMNVQMVNNAFATQKKYSKNLRKIIPVVASTYQLNESAFAGPEGITELIDATNELLPEGMKASKNDIDNYKLSRKKVFAQSVVAASTTSGVIVGAVPIPYPDALFLSSIEFAEVSLLAKIYELNKNEETKKMINSIIEVGTISLAAKGVINMLKAIPGINIGASVLNAIIAGSIVAAIGEGSIYVFEKIYKGEKNATDIDWIKKVMEGKLSSEFIENVKKVLEKISESTDKKTIGKVISDVFAK